MNKERKEDRMAELIKLAAAEATRVTLDTWEKRSLEQQWDRYTSRLWNTRILLKHYRSLKRYCAKATGEEKPEKLSTREVLETLGSCNKETYIDSIRSSVARTKAIMAHVDAMLELYHTHCEVSGRPEDLRRCRILQDIYLAETTLSVQEVCDVEGIDKSTYYRDTKEIAETLCALIFGADGLSAMRKRRN